MFLGPIPEKLQPKYAKCQNPDTMYDGLADDVTIVVSVKDSCSQAPGFIKGLERMVPSPPSPRKVPSVSIRRCSPLPPPLRFLSCIAANAYVLCVLLAAPPKVVCR